MTGKLDLTPWSRAAIPDRAALRRRVPDGHTLHISASDRRVFHVSLVALRTGLVAEASGPIDAAIDEVLGRLDLALDDVLVPVSYMRCSACGKRLGDYGDCDSCGFDESEAQR